MLVLYVRRCIKKLLLFALVLPMLSIGATASAGVTPWATQSALTNEIVYTLSIDCPTGGLVCDALDAYSDVQVATATGLGDLDLSLVAGTVQFLQDGIQDVGSGPQPSFATVDASDLTFAEIPFVGAPQTELGVTFALTNPVISAGGGPLTVGSYPISAVVDYSGYADIVGPVDAHAPEIVVTPQSVTLNGTLRILAIIGSGVAYRIEDMTASMMVSNPTTLLGEDVTVHVTADMTLNLGGNTISPGGGISNLPTLGGWGMTLLAAGIAMAGRRLAQARNRS